MRDTLDTPIHRHFNWYGELTKENSRQLFSKVAQWVAICPTYTWISTNRAFTHATVEPRNHAREVTLHLEDEKPWVQVCQDNGLWSLWASYSRFDLQMMSEEERYRRRTFLRWDKECLKIDLHAPSGSFMEWIVAPDFPSEEQDLTCIIYKSPLLLIPS